MKIPTSTPRLRRGVSVVSGKDEVNIENGSERTEDDTRHKYSKKHTNGVLKEVKDRSSVSASRVVAAILVLAVVYFVKPRAKEIEVSIILLTYSKHKKLADLLPSVLYQRPSNFEIILVDNGCQDKTMKVLKEYLFNQRDVPYTYLQLCHNPGYATGNNEGVKLAAPTSKKLLFLNDDIILSRPDFIKHMVELGEAKTNSAAVGCKLLNARGDELIEAGSIIWSDASAAGYGRGRHDINAPEFSFPRPVDYISGACLMIEKAVFEDYGGFDGENFPNYYEDTDMQLHIQHDLGKEVWLQPKSVALHAEHGSFGSVESEKMMQEGAKRFKKKWGDFLTRKHVNPPFHLQEKDMNKEFFRAADLRARDPTKAKILYIDDKAPNKAKGSGYGRSFDNLSMIAELGHRVTLTTWLPRDGWCDDECVDEIDALGIEYVDKGNWDWLVQSRIGYYDIVIVSRPSTFQATYKEWQGFFKQSSFSLIYDAEALWFRRSQSQHEIVKKIGIPFPSYDPKTKSDVSELMLKTDQLHELSLVQMADSIVTVSNGEKEQLGKLLPPGKRDIEVVGHIMNPVRNIEEKKKFKKTKGILFLASFSDEMFYNGDAIWYFLKYVYKPLVESKFKPPRLTIAGRGIPDELKDFVEEGSRKLRKLVKFVESPPTVDDLLQKSRMFIAPHVYGAGIQYKVSEALARGLPVIMSDFTKDSFGDGVPGCVGSDIESYKKCIIDLDKNRTKWEAVRDDGIAYIERTHNRRKTMERWSRIINSNRRAKKLLGDPILDPTDKCDEGEVIYLRDNRDVDEAVKNGVFDSGFHHWSLHGKLDGRSYYCNSKGKLHNLLRTSIPIPTRECDEGEKIYLNAYNDIGRAIKEGYFKSAFHHWDLHGKREGRNYYCNYVISDAAAAARTLAYRASKKKEDDAAAAMKAKEAKAADENAAAADDDKKAAAEKKAAEENAAADDEKAAAEKRAAEENAEAAAAAAEKAAAELKAAEENAAAAAAAVEKAAAEKKAAEENAAALTVATAVEKSESEKDVSEKVDDSAPPLAN